MVCLFLYIKEYNSHFEPCLDSLINQSNLDFSLHLCLDDVEQSVLDILAKKNLKTIKHVYFHTSDIKQGCGFFYYLAKNCSKDDYI
jgi:hypothetical protein